MAVCLSLQGLVLLLAEYGVCAASIYEVQHAHAVQIDTHTKRKGGQKETERSVWRKLLDTNELLQKAFSSSRPHSRVSGVCMQICCTYRICIHVCPARELKRHRLKKIGKKLRRVAGQKEKIDVQAKKV